MAKLSFQHGSGTSYHGVSINTTVNKLVEAIGEAQCIENNGKDKCNFDWSCETEYEEVFTIYDWKEYRSIGLDEEINFHIGARDKMTSINAKHELNALLNK
jgi:hypothetical protein